MSNYVGGIFRVAAQALFSPPWVHTKHHDAVKIMI